MFQASRGVAVGARLASLEVLDGTDAQASPLGEHLLGQAKGETVLPEQRTEPEGCLRGGYVSRRVLRVHVTLSLALAGVMLVRCAPLSCRHGSTPALARPLP
jgi:hypothetical protein